MKRETVERLLCIEYEPSGLHQLFRELALIEDHQLKSYLLKKLVGFIASCEYRDAREFVNLGSRDVSHEHDPILLMERGNEARSGLFVAECEMLDRHVGILLTMSQHGNRSNSYTCSQVALSMYATASWQSISTSST